MGGVVARRIRPPRHAPKGVIEGGQFIPDRGFIGHLLVKLFNSGGGKQKTQPTAAALSSSRAVKKMTTVPPRSQQRRGTSARTDEVGAFAARTGMRVERDDTGRRILVDPGSGERYPTGPQPLPRPGPQRTKPLDLIPPARPRQPRTGRSRAKPRRSMLPSDSPAVVKVSRARAAIKTRNLPTPGTTPRVNARVTDPRSIPTGAKKVTDFRTGTVTQLHRDRGELVVRWDDGRSETLPITALYPGWKPGSGGGFTKTPNPTKAQMAARLRAAVADRNSDEVTILLSRMSPDDLAELGKRFKLPRSQRTNLVLILQALMVAEGR